MLAKNRLYCKNLAQNKYALSFTECLVPCVQFIELFYTTGQFSEPSATTNH